LTLDPVSVNYLFVTYSDTQLSAQQGDLRIMISTACSVPVPVSKS
jgi:hypothetical protein